MTIPEILILIACVILFVLCFGVVCVAFNPPNVGEQQPPPDEFKVGDKVRLRSNDRLGTIAEVISHTDALCVRWDDDPHVSGMTYHPDFQLELVESTD